MTANELLEELERLRINNVDLDNLTVTVPYWVYDTYGRSEESIRYPDTANVINDELRLL